jgi:uncharacterized protein YbaR (Trm112 family)
MIDAELLAMLCCPETRQDLTEGTATQVAALNRAIMEGQVSNRAGQKVTETVDGLLIRVDCQWAYLVRQDIPVMLMDEAIPWAKLSLHG